LHHAEELSLNEVFAETGLEFVAAVVNFTFPEKVFSAEFFKSLKP
jgi:hypothetical protein